MKLLNQNQIAKVALFALGMAFALQAQAIVSKSRGVPAGWTENFEEAKEKAAKDGKFILLVSCQSDGYWGADRVRGLWGNARFAGKAKKKYVLMMIDTAKNVSNLSKRAIEENPKIMREYGIWGYNDMLILDSDGELVRRPRCDSYDIAPEDLWTKLEGETKDLIWPKPKKVDKKAKKAQAKPTSGTKTRKLAEDVAAQDNNSQYMIVSKSNELFTISGPYGIRMTADAGCEKGAEYVMKKLVNVYLPRAREYYGDPFQGKKPTRVYTIDVRMNDGLGNSEYTGPSYRPGTGSWSIGLSKGAERYEMSLDYLASSVLTVCRDAKWASFVFYVNRILEGVAKHIDPTPRLKDDIRKGLKQDKDDKNSWYCAHAPTWAVLEELRTKHPTFILDYCNLKNSRYSEGKLPEELSLEQMAELLGEVTDENVAELFSKYGVEENESRNPVRRSLSTSSRRTLGNSTSGKVSVAEKLQECDFLLNKDFKKNAKFYLCLFSASWCGPCRREMPRIAKTYVETLKDDPDIELIHFSRDQSDEKALAWAKEHDVKFPVVKPKGGNPLDLHSRGIPHLFIVKADGTLVEEGHPMKLFTEEVLLKIKDDKPLSNIAKMHDIEWTYEVVKGSIVLGGGVRNKKAVAKDVSGSLVIPSSISGMPVQTVGEWAFSDCRGLKSVSIPSSVRRIGGRAFIWTGLESVTIPSTVKSVGCAAFHGCSGLKSVTIQPGVSQLEGTAFMWCSSLKSVSIPASVTCIGDEAFSYCERLMSFSVDPDNPSYSSRDGFLCSKDGATLVAGVNGDVTIPSCVKSIGNNAFYGCIGLKAVTIPSSVTLIGKEAFFACQGLRSLTIPANVRTIGRHAFCWSDKLVDISVDSGNSCYCSDGGILYDKARTQLICCPMGNEGEVAIPSGVTSIGEWAFARHRGGGITSVTIPDGVVSIAELAFAGCDRLITVRIPASVTTIERLAFSACKGLLSVTMCGERPKSSNDVFKNCDKLTAIHVPANCKSWAGMKEWQGIPLVFDAEAK